MKALRRITCSSVDLVANTQAIMTMSGYTASWLCDQHDDISVTVTLLTTGSWLSVKHKRSLPAVARVCRTFTRTDAI